MLKLKYIYSFLCHFFTARNTKGFGVHSPFVFNFVQNVLYEKHPFYIFKTIELQRESLLNDHTLLNVTDFGAGKNRARKISDIAHKSLKQKKYAQLLFRIAHSFKAKNILELGTSLGITTAYLAGASENARVVTLEGCNQTLTVACNNFRKIGLNNIEIIEGNIDITLEKAVNCFTQLDMIFIDANHRVEPLLTYFEKCLPKVHEQTIVVIDDIYWSEGMKQAWQKIKAHEKVTSTIDLFEMGIVFFNPLLNKQHYKLRY